MNISDIKRNQAAALKQARLAGCDSISIGSVTFSVSVEPNLRPFSSGEIIASDGKYYFYLESDSLHDLKGLQRIFQELRERQTEDERELDAHFRKSK